MYTHIKKGFVTVEASIVIPLVIIAVLTVGSVMKLAYLEERIAFISGNELKRLAQDAYSKPARPFFPLEFRSTMNERMPELTDFQVADFKYKYKDKEGGGIYMDNLICMEISFAVNTWLPGNMGKVHSAREAFLLRVFCGKGNSHDLGIYDESGTDYEPVYLLPEYGVKYHTESCTYVNSYPLKSVMTSAVKRKYKACSICKSKNAARGSTVYCFKYGDSYHTASCSTVTKYTVCMDRRDAEMRGYTKCSKCGGIK